MLQLVEDLYSWPCTSCLFYTNDERVLCDIVLRQLQDLQADDPVSGGDGGGSGDDDDDDTEPTCSVSVDL